MHLPPAASPLLPAAPARRSLPPPHTHTPLPPSRGAVTGFACVGAVAARALEGPFLPYGGVGGACQARAPSISRSAPNPKSVTWRWRACVRPKRWVVGQTKGPGAATGACSAAGGLGGGGGAAAGGGRRGRGRRLSLTAVGTVARRLPVAAAAAARVARARPPPSPKSLYAARVQRLRLGGAMRGERGARGVASERCALLGWWACHARGPWRWGRTGARAACSKALRRLGRELPRQGGATWASALASVRPLGLDFSAEDLARVSSTVG